MIAVLDLIELAAKEQEGRLSDRLAVRAVRKRVSALSTAALCSLFEETNQHRGLPVYSIRGAIIDLLQERDSMADREWVNCWQVHFMEIPSVFFLPTTLYRSPLAKPIAFADSWMP